MKLTPKTIAIIAFVALAEFWFVRAILIDNNNLRVENTKFRVMQTTIDKRVYSTKPVWGDEGEIIMKASERFVIDPDLLWVVRNAENGRWLYEMGADNIHAFIKKEFPREPDNWQFYESAYLIAKAQREFFEQNTPVFDKFSGFLAKKYTNFDPEIRERWGRYVRLRYQKAKNENFSKNKTP